MRIRFLRDFQGVATGEQFYQAGEVADLPHGDRVVAEGAAELAPEPELDPDTPLASPPEVPAPIAPRRGRRVDP